MITTIILNFFINIVNGLLNMLPDMNFIIPSNVADTICNVVSGACYFLPILLLLPLMAFSLSWGIFKLVWAIILRVKSFVPTMGD